MEADKIRSRTTYRRVLNNDSRTNVVLGKSIDTLAKFKRYVTLRTFHTNRNEGASNRKDELDTLDFSPENMEAMCLIHTCAFRLTGVCFNSIQDIPDFEGKRVHNKEFLVKYFRMFTPNSASAWRCHFHGCADNTYKTKEGIETPERKEAYMRSEFYLDYEQNVETLEAKRIEMLTRAGVL